MNKIVMDSLPVKSFILLDEDTKANWEFLLSSNKTPEFLLYPFLSYFEKIFLRLKAKLLNVDHNLSDKILRHIIARDMKTVVYRVIQRPLVWEFTVANKNITNKVSFLTFIKKLSYAEQLKIFFEKYPVMKEIFNNSINNYLSFQLEFIDRLKDNFKEILHLCEKEKLSLVNFEFMGDSHCEGRKTLLLSFQSETTEEELINIIYKPRPVKLDKRFQDFIEFTNLLFEEDVLKTIKIIDKGKYGWEEFVKHNPIKRGLEKKFYYRIGVLLGIIYSLNGHDMHFENMIACGDQPILIDLECLLSIPVNEEQNTDHHWPSVCETAIIPDVRKSNDMHYDFSALLFHDNQESPNKNFELSCIDDYNIVIERKKCQIRALNNYLYYSDKPEFRVCPLPYKMDIMKGFESYYRILINNKSKIVDFVNKKFSGVIKRVIFRATFLYDKLMLESYHPRLLSDKQKYLAYISQINSKSEPIIDDNIFSSEMLDIFQGDIPCFFSNTAKACLINSRGNELIYQYPQNGIERVINKIKLLDETDLAKQCQLISRSLEDNYAR